MTIAPSTASTPRQPRKVSDQAGHRSAEQIARHGASQRAPDRDLPLLGPTRSLVSPSAIGNTPPEPMPARMRKGKQSRERRRHRAENVGEAEQRQADDHQASLAEHVCDGAEHRLDNRKSEREDCGETGGGRDADRKILGYMRQHRIQRAGGQGCRKRRKRNNIERRRHAAGARSRRRRARQKSSWQARRTPSAASPTPRTRAAAPCWARPTVRIRVGMGLDEHAGNADRDRRPRQHRHESRRWPPDEAPFPPGCCTEWVASKITGAPSSAP